ncbi:MAG: hypothetical protein AB1638_12625 [Nitrospirota bacterium]
MTEMVPGPTGKSTALYTYKAAVGRVNLVSSYISATGVTANGSELGGTSLILDDSIIVEVSKPEYEFGEDALINVTVKNDQDTEVVGTLTLRLHDVTPRELAVGPLSPIYNNIQTITIPPYSQITKSFVISQSVYDNHGNYLATAVVNGRYNCARFEVLKAFEITAVVEPSEVKINELFTLSVDVTNLMDTSASNVKVAIGGLYGSNIGESIKYTIDTLGSGKTDSKTWQISFPSRGVHSLNIAVYTQGGDFVSGRVGVKVMEPPRFFLEVANPEEVGLGQIFSVTGDYC